VQRSWVLLRGLVREQRHWEDFPEILQSHFPEDEILLYDFPGNGHRYKEQSATSIHEMMDDLRTFVKGSKITHPVHIIALSLGGMVAIEWMHKHPDECAASVLISTSLRGLNPFYERLLPANYLTILRSLFFPGDLYKTEESSLNLISNIASQDESKKELIINNWVTYAEQCPVSGMNGIRQLIAATRFRVPKQRPEVPMLVLGSLSDRLVSPECSLTLAEHWHIPIETHSLAGHDIPLDDATWVCQSIEQWLKE